MTKKGVGYLCIGVLSLGFAMLFWNDGSAKAGPLGLIPGIIDLTGEAVGDITEVTEQTGNLLEETVETTVEMPANLLDGVVDLAPVTQAVETIVSESADTVGELGAAVEETLSSTVEVVQAVTECALSPCLPNEPPLPSEGPKPHTEEVPKEEQPVPGIEQPGPEVEQPIPAEIEQPAPQVGQPAPQVGQPGPEVAPAPEAAPAPVPAPKRQADADAGNRRNKLDKLAAPEAGTTAAPEREDADIPALKERPVTPREAAVPVISVPVQDQAAAASSPIPQPFPGRKATPPATVPAVVSNTAANAHAPSPSGSGGFLYAKFADAVLAEMFTLRMNGRRNYAKNSRLLITKRGNEPPTPPPELSFFSQANEPMRRRSDALVGGNREAAGRAEGVGSAVRQPGPAGDSAIAVVGRIDRAVHEKPARLEIEASHRHIDRKPAEADRIF